MSISVIIPVFNGSKHLGACLESVLASTLPPLEILVVDDGSTDGSDLVASGFSEVRLLRQNHEGAAAARNLGVAESRGEWIAFMDADDLMEPRRLRWQADYLLSQPDLDGVFGEAEQFSDPPGMYGSDTGPQSGKLPGTMTLRRSLFETVGPLNRDFRAGEFIDWMLRAEEANANFGSVPHVVLRRRLHAENTGRLQKSFRQDYARVVMAARVRRRALSEGAS